MPLADPLVLALTFLPAFLAQAAKEPRPAGAAPPAAPVEVAGNEVRLPAWFVNPSRNLEVLACTQSGPVHETVLAFAAEGEEIYRALKEAGFRGPEFWNATSPQDLRLTGGDRAVVWIRHEWGGGVQERPAEELLQDEDTGLPFFLRGFSFSAEPVPLGDPPRRGIPAVVELTMGGQSRQSAAFSLLYHPHDLPELIPWMATPQVSELALPDLEAMSAARAPARIIIRRVGSEVELVELALSRERDPARRKVRELQRPLAEALDGRKGEFVALVGEVRGLLAEGEGRRDLSPQESRVFAERIRALLARGSRLAAEARELHLKLLDLEEAHRLEEALALPRLDEEQRARLSLSYRAGFRFELALSGKRREAASLLERGGDPRDLLRQALEADSQGLMAERERRWLAFKLRHRIRPRLAELDPKEEAYTHALFEEDERRTRADMRALRARAESVYWKALELRALAAGSPPLEPEAARARAAAQARAELAAAELKEVELMEKLRWARNPAGPSPQKDAAETLHLLEGALRAARDSLAKQRKALEKVSGEPAGNGEEPPRGGGGVLVFPEGAP